jgi:RNA polymerase sigma-70 factor (ECF subfamily)
MAGWLTTIVARVSLNMLQSRKARREDPVGASPPEEAGSGADGPEHEVVLADSVGLALVVVLDTLTPAERLAFVLHDMFAVPFEEIAPIVERSPATARKLASRARLRVQGADTAPDTDLTRQRELVRAFLAASRNGDLGALVTALDPEVVLRADQTVVRMGAEAEVRGVAAVAGFFSGRAQAARLALVNGVPGLVWATGGQPRVVFGFTITDGKISTISLHGDPAVLRDLDLVFLKN